MISSSDSSRTSSPAMKRAVEKKPLTKMKLSIKKDTKALSTDSLTEHAGAKSTIRKEAASKSCGITRPESPTLKPIDTEVGLSVDSLAEPKKPPPKKKPTKMDTSMSTDSLMAEISTTPKSATKLSPTLTRGLIQKAPAFDRLKKSSPPTQQRSPLSAARKPTRTLECSTAASRNRAAAITASYHGSPNLRKNLLEAAKTPDIPSKSMNASMTRSSLRQSTQSTGSPYSVKKRESMSNQSSLDSPSKRSPKSNGTSRIYRSTISSKQKSGKPSDEKSPKAKPQSSDVPKHLTVGSRSGTFLKDEPTVLNKADLQTAQIDV